METRETCVMVFATSLGGQKNVRVRDPRPTLSLSNVEAAAAFLTSGNVFEPEIGRLERFVSAEIITEITTPVI